MAHRRRRRCGPWCCRSVSSLGFALLTEDNLPRSAITAAQAGLAIRASQAERKRVPSRASAGSSGCVRDASYASKTSLLTRGTPRPSAHRASARSGLQPAPRLQCAPALAYNSRRPLETRASPAHRASLVCGLVDAPGLVGVLSPLSRGPYFISIPTSLGLRTTSFGSIFAMWSSAAVPSP